MKTSTMNFMIAVAALAVAAGSASAQTFKAQIPMSFRVNDSVMTAGSYEVRVASGNSGGEIIFVRNVDTHRAIAVMPGPKSDAPKEWQKDRTPRLSFTCAAGSCTLSRMSSGNAAYAYHFYTPGSRSIEARGITVVTLAMIKVR